MSRITAGAWVFATAMALGGCVDDSVVEVRLIHGETLDPATDFDSVRLVVTHDDGTVVFDDTVGGAGAMNDALAAPALDEGERYSIVLSADAPEACPLRGRAVGRSLSFEHQAQAYSVPISIGCADALQAVMGPERRVGHRVIATSDGGAVIAGGTAALDLMASYRGVLAPRDGFLSFQRYDAERGEFTGGGANLLAAVSYPSLVETPDGGFVAVGGITPCGDACNDRPFFCPSVIQSPGVAPSNLPTSSCFTDAVALDDAIAVVGGSVDGICADGQHAAIYDAAGETLTAQVGSAGIDACRRQAKVVRLDSDSALVVGDAAEGPAAEVLRRTGDSWTLSPVAQPPAPQPPLPTRWRGGAATYVACGSGGGAVYLTGGIDPDVDEDLPVEGTWCYRDGTLRYSGALTERRFRHAAHLIDKQRLLVVGGSTPGTILLPPRVFSVDGCSCADVALEPGGASTGTGLVFEESARLSNGTILIVGGGEPSLADGLVQAVESAFVFFPDVSLP